MQTEAVFPWQETIWESLLLRKKQNQLPHALLFSGIDGIGKSHFAQSFANYLLCESPQNAACGQCRSCHLQRAKSHPDFMWISPEEGAQFIKIDQIREVVNFVNKTAMLGGYRVIVFNPAHAMNTNAANALLKTLEEPTDKTLLILICKQNLRLPATISSRCQRIVFAKPDRKKALLWLEQKQHNVEQLSLLLNITNGAPLKAEEFLLNDTLKMRQDLYEGLLQLCLKKADPLQVAAHWEDKDVPIILDLMLIWLHDLLRSKLTNQAVELINFDYKAAIDKLIPKFSSKSLLQYFEMIQKMYGHIMNSLNMNRQLLLKEVFIGWNQLC